MIKLLVNDTLIETRKLDFPDGTPKLDLAQFDAKNNDNITFVWNFDSMSELFDLCAFKEAVDDLYSCVNHKFFLILPYIPNARMDRVKNSTEVFTLRTFCNIINGLNFDRILVANAHSDVSKALLKNCTDYGNELITDQLKSITADVAIDTIMFPDAGACKRYSELDAIKTKFDIVVGDKKRDWKTGTIKGLEIVGNINHVNNKNILIIDDICSRGGTFKFSAIELKKLGANNIYLYVTHCENVIDIEALKEAGITAVFTTDSIYRGSENDFIKIC